MPGPTMRAEELAIPLRSSWQTPEFRSPVARRLPRPGSRALCIEFGGGPAPRAPKSSCGGL
eukprot:6451162-Alexandrium_andersonii.AAC.1